MNRNEILPQNQNQQGISRRSFLGIGIITAISCVLPSQALAVMEEFIFFERSLSFYNLHTKEDLQTIYYRDGEYLPEALADINHIMRDHYCGAVKPIDTKLLDILYAIRIRLNLAPREPFHIISGYRTARTNEMLSKRNSSVSRKSLHIKGKAVDIRLPGHRLQDVRRAAYELKSGGVGYYPKSKFVHLDAGRVRYW